MLYSGMHIALISVFSVSGNTYSVFTELDYRYSYAWFQPIYSYFTFKVRTCDNAHILLSTAINDLSPASSYEIVIGAYQNTMSDIRRGPHGEILAQADTPNIVNCDELLPFWIRWGNTSLDVGSGPMD